MNIWFLAAALASFGGFLLHIIAGGPQLVSPLLQTQGLHRVVKFTHYYCWHMVTIILFAMGLSFARSGLSPEQTDLAIMATALAISFSLWGGGLISWKQQKTAHMPQWLLFAGIAALGAVGFYV